jgi:hypothetical protein
VSLGLRSDTLSLREVSSLLGITQTHGFEKGDINPRSPNDTILTMPSGVWHYNSEYFLQSNRIEDHLNLILNTFCSKTHILQQFLNDPAYYSCLSIWYECGKITVGLGLKKSILLRLMDFCNTITVTVALPTSPHNNTYYEKIDSSLVSPFMNGVALGIYGSNLVVDDISKHIELQPTFFYKQGNEYIDRNGNKQSHCTNYWEYNSYYYVRSENLEDHLEYLLSILEPKSTTLCHYLEKKCNNIVIRLWSHIYSGVRTIGINKVLLLRLNKICNAYYFILSDSIVHHDDIEKMKFIKLE